MPIRVVIMPAICCLVIGSLRKKNARITKSTGPAPAIGATIDVYPFAMPRLKLSSATLEKIMARKSNINAWLNLGFCKGILRIFI